MFAFAPSSVYDSTPLRQPRRHHHHEAHSSPLHATNPRDRYLAALAEAEAAEADYVAAIAREKAIQRQREEEEAAAARREAAAHQRQKSDALRRQAVLDALYAQEDPYPTRGYHTTPVSTLSRYHPSPRFDAQSDEEALIVRELERRRAVALRRQQEEMEVARVAAALEDKKRKVAAAREAKLRQCSDEELLSLLSGTGRPTVREAPSQGKLPFEFPPAISQLFKTVVEPSRHPAPCAPPQQVPEAGRQQPHSPVHELMSAIFGGLDEQKEQDQPQRPRRRRHVSFAEQPQGPSCASAAPTHSTPAPTATSGKVASFMDILNGGVNQETQDNIYTTLQSLFGPNFSDNQARPEESVGKTTTASAPAPKVETAAPAPALKQTTAPVSSAAGALKNLLQTRLNTESETEVRDTLQGLLSSMFNGANQPHSSREPQAAPPSAPATASNSGLSLKEQLEARLHHDPNVEMHDTIKAIFASLAGSTTSQAPAAASASAYASGSSSAATRAAPSVSAPTEGKGKGKADTPTQASTAGTNPTSKDVMDSMNAIHSIEAHFAVLASEFSFPTRIEFTPPSSRPSSPSPSSSSLTSDLAYTSANAPVRYYEQALSALLVQLDAVESYGNEDVRKARKEVIARVEGALEEVEREVRERFVQRQARDNVAQSQAVEKVELQEKVQEEELEAEKPVSADEAAAEESVVVDEPTHLVLGSIEPLAAPASDIEAPESKDEHTEEVAEIATTEEPAPEPVLAPASPAVEHSHLTAESFRLPVMVDSHIPSFDGEEVASFTTTVATQSAETLGSSVATVIAGSPEATPTSSYPPTPVAATVATKVEEGPETVDTFLLPNQSPVIPKRPTSSNEEEELVVVDTRSEGDWSEVDA